MVKYFDTAYIAKLYLNEPGTAEVRKLAEPLKSVVCAAHGQVELAYVFHRKLREKAIDRAGLEVRMKQVELDTEQRLLLWLPLEDSLVQDAFDSVRSLHSGIYLRGADALHLLCAKRHGYRTIYSSDRHLLNATSHFGLRGRNILPPPSRT